MLMTEYNIPARAKDSQGGAQAWRAIVERCTCAARAVDYSGISGDKLRAIVSAVLIEMDRYRTREPRGGYSLGSGLGVVNNGTKLHGNKGDV
jgi:hypothetical protein